MSTWSELYEAFRRIKGWVLGLVGVVLSVIAYEWAATTKISLRVLVPILLVTLIAFLTLADAFFEARRRRSQLPRVRRAIPPTALYADARAILLVEASDIFSHDAMVSVFTRTNDFELLIGVGFVATVQENGLIQVCVLPDDEESTLDTWQRILQNNKDELSQLLVKPSIPRAHFA